MPGILIDLHTNKTYFLSTCVVIVIPIGTFACDAPGNRSRKWHTLSGREALRRLRRYQLACKCGASLPTSTFYGNVQTQTTRPERTVSSSVNLRPARIKLLSIEAENVNLSAHINFTKTLVGAV